MNENDLLKEYIKQEDLKDLYRYHIWGIPIYPILRHHIRRDYLQHSGLEIMAFKKTKNKRELIRNIGISFSQLLKLCISRKKYKNCVFSFPRIELVGDQFIDKFTDPIIALTNLKNNTIIFDQSAGGVHLKPRIHSNIVVYRDFIVFLAITSAKLTSWTLPIIYRKTFQSFYATLNELFPYTTQQKKLDYQRIIIFKVQVSLYKFVYKRIGIKKFFGVSRVNIVSQLYAAKKCNIPTYEFQHGITYGETATYSGRKIKNFTPDYFLAFGNIINNEVYGIDPEKIINIGWALTPFINSLNIGTKMLNTDILVISESTITDKICNVLNDLAQKYPKYSFHLRLHPMETISDNNLDIIKQHKNITLQDKKINSNVVLTWFTYVIGENSTVLYEAVSIGKRVGHIAYGGLNPKYLNPEDSNCFFKISKPEDFGSFMQSDSSCYSPCSIYSDFRVDQLDILQ